MDGWKNSLIIKPVGTNIRYPILLTKLQQIWNTSSFTLLVLGSGFFIVSFTGQEECRRILTGGPYFIFGHYLHVQRWRPWFCPEREQLHSMVVWVRFPSLPVELMHPSCLLRLAQLLGRPIKLDTATETISRARYARVCIEINTADPLIPEICIEGFPQRVEYEGLKVVCFGCGIIGHKEENCPLNHQRRAETNQTDGTQNSQPQQSTQHHETQNPTQGREASRGLGEWMLVSRRKKK